MILHHLYALKPGGQHLNFGYLHNKSALMCDIKNILGFFNIFICCFFVKLIRTHIVENIVKDFCRVYTKVCQPNSSLSNSSHSCLGFILGVDLPIFSTSIGGKHLTSNPFHTCSPNILIKIACELSNGGSCYPQRKEHNLLKILLSMVP